MLTKILQTVLPIGGKIAGKFFKHKTAEGKTIAEWETEAIKASKGSWKDEFLTLVFASPIVLQVIGSIVYAFTGDIKLLTAADNIYNSFANVGLDYTQVMLLIIGASFGIHLTRTVKDVKKSQAAVEVTKAKLSENANWEK